MKREGLLALLTATTVAASLVGCGSSAGEAEETSNEVTTVKVEDGQETDKESTGAEETAAGESTAAAGEISYTSINLDDYTDLSASIKFLHHKTDREEDGTMASMIAEFNKTYPGITVTTEAVTDYAEDSLLRLSTGDWGDIMFIPAVDKTDLGTYFMPLDTLDNLSQKLNFVDSWEQANAQGLLYNKRIFKEAGITELPTTPDEFIADLELVKEKTDAIPLYTNYAAGWTMGAWDAYVGIVSNGDNTYMNQKLVHTAEPFKDPGDGTGAYNVYKILYDACAKGLIEDDYTTTDWEGCKGMLNRGEIATMVLGSWAYAQMQEAGDTPENVGYMLHRMRIPQD